ncbi:MAG: hypothetical protein HY678_09725 [Chloroflexi bacterium]|nr:hypothetical protein [Chloroflexota bacterium]
MTGREPRPGPSEERPDTAQQPEAEPPQTRTSRYLMGRMYGAIKLDGAVFRDVREDRFGTFQALQVVLLAGLSAAMSGTLISADPRVALAGAIVAWVAWVFFTHLAATRALGMGDEKPDWNRLMRTAGLSMTPAILLLFSRLPFVGFPFLVAGLVWTVVCMTAAVRHTYDQATWAEAIQASAVGWIAFAAVYAAITLSFGS